MSTLQWDSPSALRQLLCEVVSWKSESGTLGEKQFSQNIKNKLFEIAYFKNNPNHIRFFDAGEGRNAVSALYKSPSTTKTIVLISHFDTVHTMEFGDLRELAFQPEQLTEAFKKRIDLLPDEAKIDLLSNEYLFGRGVMDMKMGLVLHLYLLEKACAENWPINLLLLTVPDEEVNSAGMRAAVPGLIKLQNEFNLHYHLFLNSEPTFAQYPNDDHHYIYSGTIGKIMPTALFYGRETHAGEPLSGITSQFMASFLTQEMEFNPSFRETVYGETTPLPVCLKQTDLKLDYSTQTNHRTAALYNVFLMKYNADDVMNIFKEIAKKAMKKCNEQYTAICNRENVKPIGEINVLSYEELLAYAMGKMGNRKIEMIKNEVAVASQLDEREKMIHVVDKILLHCQELAPITIILYTPPYYPAINSSDSAFIKEKVAFLKEIAEEKFALQLKQVHYFNGISDLSYVNYNAADSGWGTYQKNMPLWPSVYNIPFAEMQQLQAPVLNVGPFGKDAHKLTERLHTESAFIHTPFLLEQLVRQIMNAAHFELENEESIS